MGGQRLVCRAAEQGHVKSEYNRSDADTGQRAKTTGSEEWQELEAEEKYKNVAFKPDFRRCHPPGHSLVAIRFNGMSLSAWKKTSR